MPLIWLNSFFCPRIFFRTIIMNAQLLANSSHATFSTSLTTWQKLNFLSPKPHYSFRIALTTFFPALIPAW